MNSKMLKLTSTMIFTLLASTMGVRSANAQTAGTLCPIGYYKNVYGVCTPINGYYSTPKLPSYNNYYSTPKLPSYNNYYSTPKLPSYNSPSALCNDGTYSYSQSRRGTCSWHGGVGSWLK